jgi:hypothetical protein
VKFIKDLWDKIIGIIDDIAQLGLQPKPIPVRIPPQKDKKR